MKTEHTECSETSVYKIQTPGNYPEENIQHRVHGESLKSRIKITHFRPSTLAICLGMSSVIHDMITTNG